MSKIIAFYLPSMHGLADASQVASRVSAESEKGSMMGPESNYLE